MTKMFTEEHKRRLSESHRGQQSHWKGKKFTLEHRQKLSVAYRGKPSGRKGLKATEDTKEKMRLSHLGYKPTEQQKIKISMALRGKKKSDMARKNMCGRKGEFSAGWMGGITKPNELARKSVEFKEWRIGVFKRDNCVCQKCMNRGGILHAHHIMPFSINTNLRYEISNGVTLCYKCHKSIHMKHILIKADVDIDSIPDYEECALIGVSLGLISGMRFKNKDLPHLEFKEV